MKFSKSLLSNTNIKDRLYHNGIDKCMELLEYIYGMKFKGNDEVKGLGLVQEETYSYTITFVFNGRHLNACYKLEPESEDILKEILVISEIVEVSHEVVLKQSDARPTNNVFWDSVKKVQDMVEAMFEIDFTPLDPAERDPRIIEVAYDEGKLHWKAVFIQDHHEGEYEIIYSDCRDLLIRQTNKHVIFLD